MALIIPANNTISVSYESSSTLTKDNRERSAEDVLHCKRTDPVAAQESGSLMDSSPPPPPHHSYPYLWAVNTDVRLLREQEREKAEQERERLEKLRGAEQAVDKHFEESLRPGRLAQYKQRGSSSWNVPSFPTNARVIEDQARQRERYFSLAAPMVHSHSRIPLNADPVTSQPPYNIMFGYPGYPQPVGMLKQEPVHVKLPTPPPSISDGKNSVIVKNDNKKRERSEIYRTTSPALLIEAQNLQPPVFPTYSHQPSPKPKVSSPAPSHMFGKPNSQPTLSTSPYQQMPTHHPPPVSTKLPPPPPAHARAPTSVFLQNCDTSSPQAQPLDLGISLTKSDSPKRKNEFPMDENEISPSKKTCLPVTVELPLKNQQESLLVIERSNSTTVESNPTSNPNRDSPSLANTLPVTTPSDNSSTTVNAVFSNGSNGASKQETSSVGAHKLKKAWLQRHSGVESTTPPPVASTPPPATPPPSTPTPPLQSIVVSNVTSPALSVRSTPPLQTTLLNVGSPATSVRSTPPPPSSVANINGHASPSEDSSSSEEECTKRVPVKVKRKKKNIIVPEKKCTSSSDSEKESDSKYDTSGKKANGGSPSKSSSSGGSNKKRGRKNIDNSPRLDDNDAPSNEKKTRGERRGPPNDPFRKPSISQLKKTGESFLQDGPCFEVAPKLTKCRECRWTPNQRSRNNANIFCRFYAFRRLRYTKNSQLAIAGFSDPHKDAAPDDLKLWLPDLENPPTSIDLELSQFILRQVASQFSILINQENEAVEMNMADDEFIAWKRVVQGVREMCDVCETTLFNFHWTCSKCGFVVCIDCYRDRKNGRKKVWGDEARDRDEASWLLCNNKQPHEQEKLMLTQIIAGDSLSVLEEKMMRYTMKHNIHDFKPSKKKMEVMKDGVKEESSESTLEWLADVALKKQEMNQNNSNGGNVDSKATPASELDTPVVASSFSTLRKLLIRQPESSDNANGAGKDSNEGSESVTDSSTPVKTEPSTSDPEPSSTQAEKSSTSSADHVKEEVADNESMKPKYKTTDDYVLQNKILTNQNSTRLYPEVPHTWLCDGKLLRLLDPQNPTNNKLFQEMWRRGQPVLVSGVGSRLDDKLWHPDSFASDFGDLKHDLINCVTGNIVPNQSVRKFWEGFEVCSKRLKDEDGQGMLLKLKDWPPGDDFAEVLPTRFSDLMKVLPFAEYTHRSGRLNLASRLPECFVKPDLGPKLYIAYGNSQHPSKATTNLHLDISDAVNVMVYVGIPKEGDQSEYMKETYRAIDEAGSDLITRRRARTKGELPGALWHIFAPQDADKIRDCLNKFAIEKGAILERNHDSIHDQSWYLDQSLRARLLAEHKVQAYTIVQCLGDAVFVPAGAPHQVRNLHSCIKVAEDFVSPENVSHCFHLTQEFRNLSQTHTNHEDKLQIKNIIYHAVKDSLSVAEAHDLKGKHLEQASSREIAS